MHASLFEHVSEHRGMPCEGDLMPEAEEPSARCPDSHIEFVPGGELPTGRNVVRVERQGAILWLIREGEMSERLRLEINDILGHVTRHGLQVQKWDGEEPPPHPN